MEAWGVALVAAIHSTAWIMAAEEATDAGDLWRCAGCARSRHGDPAACHADPRGRTAAHGGQTPVDGGSGGASRAPRAASTPGRTMHAGAPTATTESYARSP